MGIMLGQDLIREKDHLASNYFQASLFKTFDDITTMAGG
jgi:hypothetical protein